MPTIKVFLVRASINLGGGNKVLSEYDVLLKRMLDFMCLKSRVFLVQAVIQIIGPTYLYNFYFVQMKNILF